MWDISTIVGHRWASERYLTRMRLARASLKVVGMKLRGGTGESNKCEIELKANDVVSL